jgi:hypothetical protein
VDTGLVAGPEATTHPPSAKAAKIGSKRRICVFFHSRRASCRLLNPPITAKDADGH